MTRELVPSGQYCLHSYQLHPYVCGNALPTGMSWLTPSFFTVKCLVPSGQHFSSAWAYSSHWILLSPLDYIYIYIYVYIYIWTLLSAPYSELSCFTFKSSPRRWIMNNCQNLLFFESSHNDELNIYLTSNNSSIFTSSLEYELYALYHLDS